MKFVGIFTGIFYPLRQIFSLRYNATRSALDGLICFLPPVCPIPFRAPSFLPYSP